MDDKAYWMSSLQLAEISGRDHDKVMRDIRRDIVDKMNELRENLDNAKKGSVEMSLKDIDSFKYEETRYDLQTFVSDDDYSEEDLDYYKL